MTQLMTLFLTVFAQTTPQGSTPIWLPLLIIIILLLLLWWGLTRNSIPEGEAEATQGSDAHDDHHGHGDDLSHDDAKSTPVELMPEPKPEPEPITPSASVTPDDLTKIEGIGPKISSVLIAAGVTTFAQIAVTSEADLERIVKTEGGIRIAFPESWPEQAALAADGKWEALEALQDNLQGGRKA